MIATGPTAHPAVVRCELWPDKLCKADLAVWFLLPRIFLHKWLLHIDRGLFMGWRGQWKDKRVRAFVFILWLPFEISYTPRENCPFLACLTLINKKIGLASFNTVCLINLLWTLELAISNLILMLGPCDYNRLSECFSLEWFFGLF